MTTADETKPLHTTEAMIQYCREEAGFERDEKRHGLAKFYEHMADRLNDLSDTRRRLAEVEKERDDAYDRGRSHELTEGNWVEVQKERDALRKSGRCVCRFDEPEPEYYQGFKVESKCSDVIWTTRCALHNVQVNKAITAETDHLRSALTAVEQEKHEAKLQLERVRNAADGVFKRLKIRNDKEAEELKSDKDEGLFVHPNRAIRIQKDAAALAAYAALTEAAGKETSL